VSAVQGDAVLDFTPPQDEGRSKVMTLADAIAMFVKPRDVVHIAYSDARPNAAIRQLARSFAGTSPGFTVVSAGLVSIQHALVELGLVEKVVASFAGENYPVARPNPALGRAVASGAVTMEHWSLWALLARLTAGALGVSHFPVRSMRGSSMGQEAMERGELIELGPDNDTCLVSALRPDVVLLHGAAADAHGNVILAAPYGEGQAGALAAKTGVIATVEKIVSTAEIRRMNTLTRIPAHVVRAVCLAPYGAHPYGFNNPGVPGVPSYSEDDAFMAAALKAAKSPGAFGRFINEWIVSLGHEDYLRKVGDQTLTTLVRDRERHALRVCVDPVAVASRSETQVVATARRIAAAVRREGHQAVLAGVGLANLAAWIGVRALRQDGLDVELMAEIGLFGYSPLPGEPFIFSGQNVPTNKLLTDVMGVLGTYVSGPGTRSLGVVGAGQVDRTGAVNSTYGDDGGFLVGSGGANDVLSGADEVVVTVAHSRGRLVDSVPYVTSPGARVRTIVTDRCVMERDQATNDFVVTSLLPGFGTDVRVGIQELRGMTGWDVVVAPTIEIEPDATASEVAALRAFDPDGVFIRDRA
jgi:acyl CoA:acetate/3-ketoacid CoA transferase alpha subunit/acyl CoA:acetate/3-ketoacid CoA transferase beta subunit